MSRRRRRSHQCYPHGSVEWWQRWPLRRILRYAFTFAIGMIAGAATMARFYPHHPGTLFAALSENVSWKIPKQIAGVADGTSNLSQEP